MAAAKKRKARVKTAAPTPGAKLAKMGYAKSSVSRKELQKALKEGQHYAEAENWEKALPHLLKVWDVMPDDLSLLTLIAHGLSRLGVREYAIQVLERALRVNEPTVDILTVMQNLAQEMGMFEVAVKVGAQLIAMDPQSPRHYVNLATAYSGLGTYDESIDLLQQVLPLFPENADLWNVLATQVRARDGSEAADVFFEEALRINPNDYKVVSNYAQSFTYRQDFDRAYDLNIKAVQLNPDTPEPRMGAAVIAFMRGDMAEGWEHYAYRLDKRRKVTQTQLYTHGLDYWQGEPLEGKSVLVTSEQGIGDEIMFGNFLPYLYERVKQLAIGCDPRLVTIYQRRFPNAIISGHVDQINSGYRYRSFPNIQGLMQRDEVHVDYAIHLASASEHDWKTKEDIGCHDDVFLIADPERAADFKSRLQSLSKKPKVGLAWRSGLTGSERTGMYASLDTLEPLFAYKDQVDFINLQYGDCADELAAMKDRYGVTVHHFEDVNLKMDIEANLAIMNNCDVMIGACSAPGVFSMSLGVPTMLMHKAPPWYCFGNDKKIPFVKDCSYASAMNNRGWNEIMADVTNWMAGRLRLETP